IPSTEAKKLARKQIEQLAERGQPDCYRLVAIGGEIRWPSVFVTHSEVTASLPFLAWLNKEALISAIDREIDNCANDKAALSDDTRQKKLSEALRDVLAHEREEEALIVQAEQLGFSILRRPDADPRAVLGLASELPAPEKI